MNNKNIIVILFVLVMFSLAGCSSKEKAPSVNEEVPALVKEEAPTSINEKITPEKAKQMMEQEKDIIVLDVRTLEEYEDGYIKGARLIPYDEITATAESILENKSSTILIYCRSGRRSAIAADALSELGYTTIYDFGGTLDWDYELVTD